MCTPSTDFRLVAARLLTSEKDIWRQPARIGLALFGLKDLLSESDRTSAEYAEAELLTKKLRLAGKEPAQAF